MKHFFLTALSCLMMMFAGCSENNMNPEPEPNPTPGTDPDVEEVKPLTSVPFSKGFNLSDWLNTSQEYWFVPDKYKEQDFEDLKTLGVDVVRIPINFPLFMGPAPAYTFNNKLLDVLDNVVEWASSRGIYIILDQHSSFSPAGFTADKEELVASGLRQLASRYKGKDHVLIEVFNEPNGDYVEKSWNEIQLRLISEIRNIDKNVIIIATGVGGGITRLRELPKINDDRIIYTFHYYNPFLFTHQGAEWIPSKHIANVPFPYDADKMPPMPNEFKGNAEYEGYYNIYSAQGNERAIAQELMEIYSWATDNNRLIFCGEFGTLTTASKGDRNRWYKAVCDNLAAFGIAWTAWEYSSGSMPNFGVFKGTKNFETNLDADLIRAMGLNVPPQYESGCPEVVYYDDDVPEWWSQGSKWDGYEPKIDFSCKENPYDESLKCIRWDIDNVWGGLTMSTWPVTDFSEQYDAGAHLEFAIRTTDVIDKMIVRFVQYKTGAPWNWRIIEEISTTNDEKPAYKFANDGKWHLIKIPLQSMWICGTQGAWKLGPEEGDEGFAWDCIQHLEFAPEGNESLIGKTVFIDNIRIRK